jgi:hypothetical protein
MAPSTGWPRQAKRLRTPQLKDRWCYGKTPMQGLVDSVPLAKEKM